MKELGNSDPVTSSHPRTLSDAAALSESNYQILGLCYWTGDSPDGCSGYEAEVDSCLGDVTAAHSDVALV